MPISARAQGTSSNTVVKPARFSAVVTRLVARPPPGMLLSVNGGQLSATRRKRSWPRAGSVHNTPSIPRTQSSGRMLKSFAVGEPTLKSGDLYP